MGWVRTCVLDIGASFGMRRYLGESVNVVTIQMIYDMIDLMLYPSNGYTR